MKPLASASMHRQATGHRRPRTACSPWPLIQARPLSPGKTQGSDRAWGGRWEAQQPPVAWKRLMDNKNKELDRLNGVYKKILDGAGVEYHEGRGTIVDPHTIDVDGKRFTVRWCLVAGHLPARTQPHEA